MANFKKIDDHDFIFVNKTLTAQEEKEFSDFLKTRKTRVATKGKEQPFIQKKGKISVA